MFSTFNTFNSNRVGIVTVLALKATVTDYSLRVKGSSTTVPTVDLVGNTLNNVGGVTMYKDATRGYVFNFTGANYLYFNSTVTTPTNVTRTYWVSTLTPNASGGNTISSSFFPNFFGNSSYLNVSPNFQMANQANITSTTPQTTTWIFYAVTVSSSTLSLYVNGTLQQSVSISNWGGDTSTIDIGAYKSTNFYTGYLDDIRQYPSVLSAAQILAIYNGA